MEIDPTTVDEVLAALGEVLDARHAPYEIVVIGGSGLLLLGTVERATADVDILGTIEDGAVVAWSELPPILDRAVREVAATYGLAPGWLNAKPSDLVRYGLPEGFVGRLEQRRYGALTVLLAGRLDQMCFKLYAATDQGPKSKHVADMRALDPSGDELRFAAAWCRTHDPSEGFDSQLRQALAAFGVDDG